MTNLLYSLMIFNERLEGFFIGLFESSEKARQVAEHYLSALPDSPYDLGLGRGRRGR